MCAERSDRASDAIHSTGRHDAGHILLVHHHPGTAAEIRQLVTAVASTDLRCSILVSAERLVRDIADLNVPFTVWRSAVSVAAARRLSRYSAGRAPRIDLALRHYALVRENAEVMAILAELSPDIVCCFANVPLVPIHLLIAASNACGIPVLQVPFADADRNGLIALRERRSMFQVDSEPLADRRRKLADRRRDWVAVDSADRRQFYFDAITSLALDRAGLGVDSPWNLGGGFDRVCMLSDRDAAEAASQGLDSDKIAVTGQPSLARLSAAYQNRNGLRTRLLGEADPRAKQRLCILSPSALVESGLYAEQDFWAEIETVVLQARAVGYALFVSIHPKMGSRAAPRFRELGVEVLELPLVEALPAADLFVTHPSSTLRWSSMLGIPAISLNGAGLDYSHLFALPHVTVVCDEGELASVLDRVPPPAEPVRKDLEILANAPSAIIVEAAELIRRRGG